MEQPLPHYPAQTTTEGKAPTKPYDPYNDPLTIWKGGRPYKYANISEAEARIDTYFLECEATGEKPNVAGLALALDTSYRMLLTWEHLKAQEGDTEAEKRFKTEFSQLVSRAKVRCSRAWWASLEDRDKARGAEFALKVMGFQDKPEHQPAGNITINQQNNVLVGNPAQLTDLFGGLLPTPVQKALDKT